MLMTMPDRRPCPSPLDFRCYRPLRLLLLGVCWLCLLLEPPGSWAATVPAPLEETAPADAPEEDPAEESLTERTIEAIDERHEQLSRRVLATADWLDAFFADERLDAEAQETRLVVGFSLFAEDSRGLRFDLASRFHLSLPFASERLQLVFSGDPDDGIGTDPIPRQELRRRLRDQREQTVTVGLRYQLRQTLRSNSSLRAGLRVRNGNPVLLLEPRYRQDAPVGACWLFRFTQRFAAYSDDTYEVRSTFDLERPLAEISDELFFRITVEGNWYSDRIGYEPALHLNLFQTLSPRRAIDYRLSTLFQSRPNYRRESTVLSVLYRQKLGRDWLYGELAPQLAFPRERHFQPTAGIMLNLGVILGDY
jgi:hypothetical protein